MNRARSDSHSWIFQWITTISLGLALTACSTQSDSTADGSATGNSNNIPMPYPTFRSQGAAGEKNFAKLINGYPQGKLNPTPWAGYWWPYTKNGIGSGGFFEGGSPAGKYDAARGGTTQAQSWELQHHGARVPKVQGWWGHCNGWCAAAALFPEPKEPVTVNGITFGVGDIKGLLTEAAMLVAADFFGERLDVDDPSSPKYWDTVPNQFFLVLTNYIGKENKPVLIDRYTGHQVWNQPLAGYKFEYPKPADYLGNSDPQAPHLYKIMMTGTIYWMDDNVSPDVITPEFDLENDGASNPYVMSRTLRMELWLDGPVVFDSAGKIQSSGNIVVTRDGDYLAGGFWREGDGFFAEAWPDYMWIPYSVERPVDPDQDHVNPEVDIKWIEAHLLVPGGADDPSVTPLPVQPAPAPRPTSSSFPFPISSSFPFPFP